MAIFEHQPRSANLLTRGEARILTLDKHDFFRRINEDPSLAIGMIATMSRRVPEPRRLRADQEPTTIA